MNKDVTIDWLAGFFEGEGCIAAQKLSKQLSCGVSHTRIQVKVCTTNKSEPKRFKMYFGTGAVSKAKSYEEQSNRQTQWEWRINGRDVVRMLAELMPRLHGPKKKQAQLAIKHGNVVKRFNGREVPKEAAKRRVEIVEKIQSMTQQGGFDV